MDEDIFKDMIDYGDEKPASEEEEMQESEEAAEEEMPEAVIDNTESSYEEEEENTASEFVEEYTADMDEEEYEYEYEAPEEEEEALVAPMIKPMLKYLIPLFAVLAFMVFMMTSNIGAIKTYRENFIANAGQLMYNMGIDLSQEEAPDENTVEDESSVEYKEVVPVSEEDDETVQYRTEVLSDVKLTFDGASGAKFVSYGEGVICAKTNYLCYINKDGVIEWEKNVSIIDPILKAEGDYFLLAQKNGVRFVLYSGAEEVYQSSSEDNILTANVSANGDVVLVTDKAGYKGAISVYNKRGDKAFAWSSGSASIISADISAKSRRVAAALLYTDDTVRSGVYLFDIKKPDSYAQQSIEDSVIYNVDFKDDNLNVFADNSMTGMKISGKISYNIDFGSSELALSGIDENGDKIMLFTGNNVPMMNIYNKNGKLKNTVSARKIPDYAHVFDGNIIYNVDREIFLSKLNTRIPYKYTAAMDIQGIVPIDSKSFMIVYSNSVSLVRMKGVLW